MAPLMLSSIFTLMLAQGAPVTPSYEALNARVGAGPQLPKGCEQYSGTLKETWRLPIAGKGEAEFRFTGRLTPEGWTAVTWTPIDYGMKRGFMESEDGSYNDGTPVLGPIHGGDTEDEREGTEEIPEGLSTQVNEVTSEDGQKERSVSLSFKIGSSKREEGEPAAPTEHGSTPPERGAREVGRPSLEAAESPGPEASPSALSDSSATSGASSSDGSSGFELSWSERLAAQVALGRVMKDQEETIRAAGLDPEALEQSLREALKEPGEMDFEAIMAKGMAEQIKARPELQALGLDSYALLEQLMAGALDLDDVVAQLEALEDSGELATGALVSHGLSEAEAKAALEAEGLVEAGGLYYESAADIPERAVKEGQIQEELPQPEAEGIYGEIQEILSLVDTEVELRHVVPLTLDGRGYYELQRVAHRDSTFFGGERVTGSFVVVEGESLLPLSYRVVVEHPIRLRRKTGAPGKIKSLTYKLDQDLNGHIDAERIEVGYNLGPIIVRLDRTIDWAYEGVCELAPPEVTQEGGPTP